MGTWAKPRLVDLSRERRMKPWARGVRRRFWKAREDAVLHSSPWTWQDAWAVQQRAHPVPYRGQSAGRTARGRELLSLTAGAGHSPPDDTGKTRWSGDHCLCQHWGKACPEPCPQHTAGWMDGRVLAAHERLRRNLICLKINQFKEPLAPLSFRTRHISHTYISFFSLYFRVLCFS